MRSSLVPWVFLIQFLAVFFGIDVVLVAGQCQRDQRDLLLQLKNSLNFSSASVKLVKWSQSSDCCSWDGVICDAGGHVTGLDLNSESISGRIQNSSSLFNLQHLQSLNLANNSFNSSIPPGIDRLASLSYLNLSSAGFSGQIPIEISRLTSLVTLDLSVSFFRGSELKLENPNLAMLTRNLKELKQLFLGGLDLSAQKNWCQVLSYSLPKLEELSMSNCLLSGPIDSSLSKLQSLSVINLDGNSMSGPIPEFFAKLSNLTSLNLAASGLEGKVPEVIFQLRSLKTINLLVNPFLEGSFKEFLPGSSLEALLLGGTSFGGSLPESIGNLGRLSKINLAGCNFNGSIPNAVGKLTNLDYLDLSSNNFSGPIPSLSSLRNLTQLNLAHNQLTGSISSTNWTGFSKLEIIDLRNNSLNGTLPASLFGIPTLQKMQLLQNQFTGRLNEPAEIAFSLLDTVDVSSNKLAGQFPIFLSQLQNLKILSLSFNNFSGPVNLSSFQQLKSLSSLDLSYNSLSINTIGIDPALFPQIRTLRLASCKLGEFPDFLKEQEKLSILDVSKNQIGGEIPDWIWSFGSLGYLNLSSNILVKLREPLQGFNSTLSVLDLSCNNLQGQLPKPPPSATVVDYSSNSFSSVIPDNIGEFLNFTYFISLSNNNLYGSIPQSICNATFLRVINLSNNTLNDTIPPCLIWMNSLGVLNVRGNNLSGTISDTFSNSCMVQTIDLNGNQLEGKIPRSLANCTQLEVLDLGNNLINDEFPCHLKNISSLRVLVLRSNQFHGRIGCPNDNSSWQMLQIVDLASNKFSGELPNHCLRTWQAMMSDENDLQHISYEYLSLNSFYYQDAITVTMKGLEVELVKILTVFTSIDLSCNNLEGEIPIVVAHFQALYVLNLSHNALTGPIPSFLGNLTQLESLDLSSNSLTGVIPQALANLYFLSVLNLSFNHLVGRIPTSNQFQTFPNSSFEGNDGLCGFPLTKKCEDSSKNPDQSEPFGKGKLDWPFILTGLSFGVGAALVVAPLMFCKRASKRVDDIVDKILLTLFPLLPLVRLSYDPYWRIKTEEEENHEEGITEASISDNEEAEATSEVMQGRYCIYCSKIDILKKKVVHDPKCTCPDSPPPSFSSASPSSVSS